jgi:hypothetical protein
MVKRQTVPRIYAIVCCGFAVTGFYMLAAEWRVWRRMSALAVFGGLCALFAATALSILRRWRAGRWLAGASGLVLILYALSVLTMGWEDVGGARGALPLALPTAVGGLLGIVVAIAMRREHQHAA